MKRLPVKSLLQFRTVSKAWKSLIDSPRFTARYSSQQQHLLVSYFEESIPLSDSACGKTKYVSVVDDDTFPHQKVSHDLPQCVNMLDWPAIIGTSHGLFCLHGDRRLSGGKVVIWNPSIRKAVVVVVHEPVLGVVPNAEDLMYENEYRLGFGVCRETTDSKIVAISRSGPDSICLWQMPWQVEVFALSTRAWRSPKSSNLPRISVRLDDFNTVVVDGVVYWLAWDWKPRDGEYRVKKVLIVSFDLTSEEFEEVNLPNSLAHHFHIEIYELRGPLLCFNTIV